MAEVEAANFKGHCGHTHHTARGTVRAVSESGDYT